MQGRKKSPLIYIGAGLLFSLATTSAVASATLIDKAAPDGWVGAYIGTYYGSGRGNINTNLNQTLLEHYSIGGGATQVDTTTTSGSLNGDTTGSVADFFLGYNFRRANTNFIFGGQIEGTFFSSVALKSYGTGNNYFTQVVNGVPIADPVSTTSTQEYGDNIDSMFAAVARGGFLINSATMLYGLAGPVVGHFSVDDPTIATKPHWELGYTLGAGAEYALNTNWSIRAEYRFLHFHISRNTSTSQAVGSSYFSTTNLSTSSNANFNMGTVGIVYRFG
jgi:outer membrane immunogenic protein